MLGIYVVRVVRIDVLVVWMMMLVVIMIMVIRKTKGCRSSSRIDDDKVFDEDRRVRDRGGRM